MTYRPFSRSVTANGGLQSQTRTDAYISQFRRMNYGPSVTSPRAIDAGDADSEFGATGALAASSDQGQALARDLTEAVHAIQDAAQASD